MSNEKKAGVKRLVIVGLLIGAVGLGLSQLREEEREIADFVGATQPILEERARLYADLRKAGDWSQLYEMVHPAHRRTLSKRQFLQAHQHGVMETRVLDVVSLDIDEARRTGKATYALEAKMVVASLPSHVRSSLRLSSPEQLVRKSTFDMHWVWRDDSWFFLLEKDVVSRRDSQGTPITLMGSQTR